MDTFATREDNQLLTREIRTEMKQYVEIANAGHLMQYETVNVQFFKAVRDFLEAKLEKKK